MHTIKNYFLKPGRCSWNTLHQLYRRYHITLTRLIVRCTCIVLGLSWRLCSPSIWLFWASASMADCCCRILLAVDRNDLRNLLLNPAPTPPPPAPPPPPNTRCTPLSDAVDTVALFDLPCCWRCLSAVCSLTDFAAAVIVLSCRRRGRESICGMLACLPFPANIFGCDRRSFAGSTKAAVTVVVAGMVSAAVATSACVDISCCSRYESLRCRRRYRKGPPRTNSYIYTVRSFTQPTIARIQCYPRTTAVQTIIC